MPFFLCRYKAKNALGKKRPSSNHQPLFFFFFLPPEASCARPAKEDKCHPIQLSVVEVSPSPPPSWLPASKNRLSDMAERWSLPFPTHSWRKRGGVASRDRIRRGRGRGRKPDMCVSTQGQIRQRERVRHVRLHVTGHYLAT